MSKGREDNNRKKKMGFSFLISGFPLVLRFLSFPNSVSQASSFPPNLVLRHHSFFRLLSIQTSRNPRAFHSWILGFYLKSQTLCLRSQVFHGSPHLGLQSPTLGLWTSNSRLELSIQLGQVFYPTKATCLHHSCQGFDGLKPEDSIYLETQVFSVFVFRFQVSNHLFFYFRPSIHYGPSTWCIIGLGSSISHGVLA